MCSFPRCFTILNVKLVYQVIIGSRFLPVLAEHLCVIQTSPNSLAPTVTCALVTALTDSLSGTPSARLPVFSWDVKISQWSLEAFSVIIKMSSEYVFDLFAEEKLRALDSFNQGSCDNDDGITSWLSFYWQILFLRWCLDSARKLREIRFRVQVFSWSRVQMMIQPSDKS